MVNLVKSPTSTTGPGLAKPLFPRQPPGAKSKNKRMASAGKPAGASSMLASRVVREGRFVKEEFGGDFLMGGIWPAPPCLADGW